MTRLPYLTAGIPGLAAVYKARWEDFHVEELPKFEPDGQGDHTWIEIEKHGLATPRAVSDVARALGVKPSSIGYAGMKDARAVARQWISVEHVEPERVRALEIPRIAVLRAERHPRKLRRGWHAGNRFRIKLRSPEGGRPDIDVIDRVLDALAVRGVPNYYGPQRFGTRGDTWRVGRALARTAWAEAAGLIAGRPLTAESPDVDPGAGVHPDSGDVMRARELYDEGRYIEAADAWPRGFGQCARLARAMDRTGGDAARAIRVVGTRMLRLYASAYQSWLFNHVLAERIADPGRLLAGDLAWKHDSEALFEVVDPAEEQPRADRFEISPTGPLVGRRMREPTGDAAALESRILERSGFDPEELESAALRPLTGRRRPLRFRVSESARTEGDDDLGGYVELRFSLPPGCYATAVLRELGKGGVIEGVEGFPAANDEAG